MFRTSVTACFPFIFSLMREAETVMFLANPY